MEDDSDGSVEYVGDAELEEDIKTNVRSCIQEQKNILSIGPSESH